MSDGFELFFRRWKTNKEAERTVLCLHGIGAHSGFFRNIGPELAAQGADVYAIDRRGFGNSVEEGFERGGVSNFPRYLQDVTESADQIRGVNPGKKFFVFGKSLGCVHALRYAANKPNSLDGLILAAPPILTKTKLPKRALLKMIFLILFAQGTMIDGTKYLTEKMRQSDELKVSMEDPLCTQKFSVRYLNGALRSFLRTALKNAALVQTPTLIIQGDADNIVVPEGARKLLEGLATKNKDFKTFPDADHNFYDVLDSRTISNYDSAKRAQVVDTVNKWIWSHE
jgi:alpha-beta hydrolase superfamily lysophospholipase